MIIKTKYAEHINTVKITRCRLTEVTAIFVVQKQVWRWRVQLSICFSFSFSDFIVFQKQKNKNKKTSLRNRRSHGYMLSHLCVCQKRQTQFTAPAHTELEVSNFEAERALVILNRHTQPQLQRVSCLVNRMSFGNGKCLNAFVLRWHLKRTGKSCSSFSLSKWRDGWHNHKKLPKGIFHYRNYQQSPQGKAKCERLHSVAGGWELGTGTGLRVEHIVSRVPALLPRTITRTPTVTVVSNGKHERLVTDAFHFWNNEFPLNSLAACHCVWSCPVLSRVKGFY